MYVRVTQLRCKMRSKAEHSCKKQIDTFEILSVSFWMKHIFRQINYPLQCRAYARRYKELSKFTYELNSNAIDRHLFAFHKCEFYFESPLLHSYRVRFFRQRPEFNNSPEFDYFYRVFSTTEKKRDLNIFKYFQLLIAIPSKPTKKRYNFWLYILWQHILIFCLFRRFII